MDSRDYMRTTMKIRFKEHPGRIGADGMPGDGIFRPAFNFGNNILCSGQIINTHNYPLYKFDEWYEVDVCFLVDKEGYEFYGMDSLISIGMELNMQAGSQVIGQAIMLSVTLPE